MPRGTTLFRGPVEITGNLTVDGTSIVAGAVNDSLTIATAKTLTVTDADALIVGGKIVPQTFLITRSIFDGATTAAFDGVIPIPVACKLVSVKIRWQTASSAAETLMLNKVPSGTAKSAGTNCLAAGIDLQAVADTNVTPALHATAGNYTFAAGDGLGFVASGAPTALDGVGICAEFKRV
jgi:phage baseplate assembly protein gpV